MKRLLLIVISASIPCLTFAQPARQGLFENPDKRFWGGIVAGLNCSQVDGDTYSGFHSAGLNAGGLVYWAFAKKTAASMGFMFSQKGSHGVNESYSPYGGAYYAKYKLRLNYIEVPVVLHYLFNSYLLGFDGKYLLGVGGAFNALLGSKESMEDMGSFVGFNEGDYPFNKSAFDIIGSLGLLLGGSILVEARYQYGLTPLRDAANVPLLNMNMGGRDQFNNTMSFRLVYLF
ncbi:MAG TPA: outer membrane beta-barrel protein [Edaphocola sp.]|nr:outer membrane beta-barrel protein [Edaphocola sp.]